MAGWLPPKFAHKRIKALLSGRHWVGLLMINFFKEWIFFHLCARSVRACVSVCAPAFIQFAAGMCYQMDLASSFI